MVEVLGFINTINDINELYTSTGFKNLIDNSILYKIIESTLTNKVFNNEELKDYCKAMIDFEQAEQKLLKFTDFNNIEIPYESQLVFLGLSLEEHDKLSEEQIEELHDKYGDIFCDLRFENISTKDYIEKSKALINETKEEIKKGIELLTAS